jgi:hypothetical protein
MVFATLKGQAVPASIGRAIRHEKDYAAILLLDYRFSSASIQEKVFINFSISCEFC